MPPLIDNFDQQLTSVYESALASGELIFTASETHKSKETEYGIECEICYAPSLAKKPLGILPKVEEDQTTSSDRPSTPVVKAVEKTNPFLPHSPGLYVTDAGEEHKILLNKFCIVPRHFLVVTKEFQPQTGPLTPDDLMAVWSTLKAVKNSRDAVAFYNCGSRSGASQPHKHMQVIPLESPSPISELVREVSKRRPGKKENKPGDLFSVPFHCINHVILLPDPAASNKDEEDILIEAYITLVDAMMMSIREYAEQEELTDEERMLCSTAMSSFAYNWILTKEFMMIVPRKQEGFGPISINSLGFAGMVLAKTAEELEMVQKTGVMDLVSKSGFVFHQERTPEQEQKSREMQQVLETQMGSALSSL
ncbi:bifunctional AP-4-A phosphorylase/ADP sulfurylase [Podila verticillata]|nr:bifunctional AP-4-A phosphorylase/ADP sulfurylase [Podila verticillata]